MHPHTANHGGFPWIVPVILPVIFGLVPYLIARFGWTRLAETHPGGPQPPDGPSYRSCSGRIGLTSYNRCLNVTIARAGVHVVPVWFVRLFHPPLLLPWSGVRRVEDKHFLFIHRTMLVFEDPGGPKFTLYLPGGARADIAAASGRSDFYAPRSQ